MVIRKGCLPPTSLLNIEFGEAFDFNNCIYLKVDIHQADKTKTTAISLGSGEPMAFKNDEIVIPVKCELVLF